MEKQDISLSNVIDGDYTLTQEQLDSFKSLLLKGMRSAERIRRIHRLTLDKLPHLENYGIYRRVMFGENGRCWYNAGQSYPDEIRTVRECILKG